MKLSNDDKLMVVLYIMAISVLLITAFLQVIGHKHIAIGVFVFGFITMASAPKWYINLVKKIARIK